MLFLNPTVFEAVLTFCLAGVVPGTGVVLSPNAVIAIVGGVLGFIALLIFVVPVTKRNRRRRRVVTSNTADESLTAANTVPAPVSRPAVVVGETEQPSITPQPPQQPNNPHPLKVKIAVAMVLVRSKIKLFIARVAPALSRFTTLTAIVVRHEAKAAARRLRIAYEAVKKYTVIGALWLTTQGVAAWKWLKPRIHQFDAWLAAETKPLRRKLAKKARKNDTLMLLRDVTRGLRKEIQPYSPFTLWGKLREEQQRSKRQDAEID